MTTPKSKKPKDVWVIPDALRLGQKYIAHLYGLTFQAIQSWKDCPRNKDKTYNIRDVVQWRREQDTMMASGGDASEGLERYRLANAALKELELAQRRGELAEVSEVDAGISRMVIQFKQALLALPAAVAPRLEGLESREIAPLLDGEVRRILRDLREDE